MSVLEMHLRKAGVWEQLLCYCEAEGLSIVELFGHNAVDSAIPIAKPESVRVEDKVSEEQVKQRLMKAASAAIKYDSEDFYQKVNKVAAECSDKEVSIEEAREFWARQV